MQQWVPYCGAAPLPAEIMARWNLDPLLLAALAGLAFLFTRAARSSEGYRMGAFAGGFALLLLVFVSPLCALSSALFSVRATHHLLLAAIAAPLFALSLPRLRVPGGLAVWTGAQALALWLWHAPPVYEAALSNDALFWLLQMLLLGSATAFWIKVRQAEAPAAALALIASMIQMGLLGAIITFAPHPLYAPHFLTTSAWGVSPIEDQQVAGLLMWVPAAGVYLAAALWLIGRSLKPDSYGGAMAR